MTTGSIIVMIIGCLVIWGGLATSIIYAVKKTKEPK